jgi:hypothetical protein
MVMSVYLVLEFSSGSKDLKREGKRLETIHVPVGLAQTLTLFEKIIT